VGEGSANTIRLEPGQGIQVPQPALGRITEAATMTLRYAVGIRIRNKADQMTVEAEDALIAALKVKTAHPEAAITYVRKRNARGDRRHPHSSQIDQSAAEPAAGRSARSPSSVQTVHGTVEETMPDPLTQASGPAACRTDHHQGSVAAAGRAGDRPVARSRRTARDSRSRRRARD
jgi:hypothetical protein